MYLQRTARMVGLGLLSNVALAGEPIVVSDEVIAKQREALSKHAKKEGAGPQSPRDIDQLFGRNPVHFSQSPASSAMNLCNIHFHKNAEHKGGEFTRYAGNGNGKGFQTGYRYSGQLSKAELAPRKGGPVCRSQYSEVDSGDTIEVHYVYSTAKVKPGPTLGSCLIKGEPMPQLRVETQVYVAVNDEQALDFEALTAHDVRNGLFQAVAIPNDTGTPVTYAGSTTGPAYNEVVSPFQVTWNVRPKIAKVNIDSLGDWCDSDNVYQEDYAHGVRNLVTNPELLSNKSN